MRDYVSWCMTIIDSDSRPLTIIRNKCNLIVLRRGPDRNRSPTDVGNFQKFRLLPKLVRAESNNVL